MIHLLIIWMTIGAMWTLGQWTNGYIRNPEVMEKLLRHAFQSPKYAAVTIVLGLIGWPFSVYLALSGSRFANKANDIMATAIRREFIDGPKWKAALADQPRTAVVRGFSWGPGAKGRTCDYLNFEGKLTCGCDAGQLCGKPAAVSTTTLFDNGPDFEMNYCEEHRPAKTRECPTCGGQMEGPYQSPFCPSCPC